MTPETVVTIGRHALEVTLLLSAPLLLDRARRGSHRRHFPGGDPDQRDDAVVHPETARPWPRCWRSPARGCCARWSSTSRGPHRKHSRDDWLGRAAMSIALTTGQLEAWVAQGSVPFARIGACLMVAPVFGARFVPPRTRVILAVAITALVAPLIPAAGDRAVFAAGFVVVVAAAADRRGARLRAADRVRRAGTRRPVAGQQHGPVVRLQRRSAARQQHRRRWASSTSFSPRSRFLALDGHPALHRAAGRTASRRCPSVRPVSAGRPVDTGVWGGQLFAGAIAVALPGSPRC